MVIIKNLCPYEGAIISNLKKRGMSEDEARVIVLDIRRISFDTPERNLRQMNIQKDNGEFYMGCPDIDKLIDDYFNGNMSKYSAHLEEEEYVEEPDDDRDLISIDPYGGIATDPFEHLIQMGRDAHRYK